MRNGRGDGTFSKMYDVIIVGGGAAGKSAALVLGRACRRVLLCDTGHPRNAVSGALHGFLTRDGMNPGEFLRTAGEELRTYDTVEVRAVEVSGAWREEDGFRVSLGDGGGERSRALLLATGRTDILPEIEGARALYGRGVYQCQYCDGWENRDGALVVYGNDSKAVEMAVELLGWSRDVVLCTGGPAGITTPERRRLARHRVRLMEGTVARLEDGGEGLAAVVFQDGSRLSRQALFFYPMQAQHSALPARLGCHLDEEGAAVADRGGRTNVPGVYVAGNVRSGLQLSIVAAAEGAEAACAINTSLQEVDFA